MSQMVLSTAELCSVGCSESMSTKRTAVSLQTAVGSDEWEKRRSTTHNADYWYNVRTGERAWKDPSTGADEQPGQPTAKKVKIAEAAQTSVDKTIVWKKMFSTTYKRDYWCNDETGERRWDDPNTAKAAGVAPDPSAAPRSPVKSSQKKSEFRLTQRVLTDPAEITAELERERQAVAVDAPSCPREVSTANLAHIVHRLRTESAAVVHDKSPNAEHPVVFRLADDDTAMITRAVQEDQILKTRLKVQLREGVADLPSFWDVWERDSSFRQAIIGSADPNEAKWKLQTSYNYKLATTFMPPYAKAIYEHFNAKSVLDPCAGWGDRMVGAASSSLVERYVCFDPNTTLRPGYAALMKLFGHEVTELSAQKLQFSNGFAQYALPFEEGALQLPDCSFDLVFTSPPFFDYEMYNPRNPQYGDEGNWIERFYKPLFIQACRLVKPGHHFAIHVGDTSAGSIGAFLRTQVQRVCALKLVSRLGLHGMMSGKTRTVWVYRKAVS
jgi:hypothetical protein